MKYWGLDGSSIGGFGSRGRRRQKIKKKKNNKRGVKVEVGGLTPTAATHRRSDRGTLI